MKKNVLVLYTGGTIGMKPSDSGLVPEKNFLTDKINQIFQYELPIDDMPHVTVVEYSPLLDSSDLTIELLNKIARDIYDNVDSYDGFVILHGTDTMAYTSSALSFMLQNINKPVIITGSQLPFSQFRSDGRNNLINALFIAANLPVNEVCLFFNDKLMRGNRVTKFSTDGFDAFKSLNVPAIAEVGVQIKLDKNYQQLPSADQPLTLKLFDNKKIEFLFLYPGYPAESINRFIDNPPDALILNSFGSGNVPVNDVFQSKIQALIQQGVIVINKSQCVTGTMAMETYKGGFLLKKAGVYSSFDMTNEAIVMKLFLLLSDKGNQPFEQGWHRCLAREFS